MSGSEADLVEINGRVSPLMYSSTQMPRRHPVKEMKKSIQEYSAARLAIFASLLDGRVLLLSRLAVFAICATAPIDMTPKSHE